MVDRSNLMPIVDELMTTPFLANHCVLAGFDGATERKPTEEELALIAKVLATFETVKVKVLRKDKEGGYLVVEVQGLEALHTKQESKKEDAQPSAGKQTSFEKRYGVITI